MKVQERGQKGHSSPVIFNQPLPSICFLVFETAARADRAGFGKGTDPSHPFNFPFFLVILLCVCPPSPPPPPGISLPFTTFPCCDFKDSVPPGLPPVSPSSSLLLFPSLCGLFCLAHTVSALALSRFPGHLRFLHSSLFIWHLASLPPPSPFSRGVGESVAALRPPSQISHPAHSGRREAPGCLAPSPPRRVVSVAVAPRALGAGLALSGRGGRALIGSYESQSA